ncbi:MAG: hypothetical protein H7A51_14795 [Akkermansiaceae bacterium]|nr:hypothetical protein [Akkermansiaceae bacterium]
MRSSQFSRGVPDLKGQTDYYHRHLRIEGNRFDTFDVPLVFAISTRGLVFSNNTIRYNNDYKAWKQPPFILRRCTDVKVTGNRVINAPRPWSRDKVFDLQLTPEDGVEYRK